MRLIPAQASSMWGVYDSFDRCWIGPGDNSKPPYQFPTREMCEDFCKIVGVGFGMAKGRLQAQPFPREAVKFKDKLTNLKIGAGDGS